MARRTSILARFAFGLSVVGAVVAATSASARQLAPVTWLVFVDDLHLDFSATGQLRSTLRSAFDVLVRDGDRVVIRSSGPSTVALQLTMSDPPFDRDRLAGAIKRMTGNALKPDDMAGRRAQREVRYRARASVDALRQLVDAAGSTGGPTALLYVSNDYTSGATDSSAVVAQANRAAAPLFPIDPRPHLRAPTDPFIVATRGSLRDVANASGGTWQDDGETLADYLTRIAAAMGR